jgi:hypothetical protein
VPQPYRQPLLVEPDRYAVFQRLTHMNERARDVREVFPPHIRQEGTRGHEGRLTSPAEIIDEPMEEKGDKPAPVACATAEGVSRSKGRRGGKGAWYSDLLVCTIYPCWSVEDLPLCPMVVFRSLLAFLLVM